MVVNGFTPGTAAAVVVITFKPARCPSTETLMALTVSETPNPVPDTLMTVPFGPDVFPSEAVGAADANDKRGAAIAMISSVVSNATVVFLSDDLLIKLFILFFFSKCVLIPFFRGQRYLSGISIFNTSVNSSRRQLPTCIQK